MNDLQSFNTEQTQNSVAKASGETASQVLAAQTKAMVESRFVVAKKCTRDMDVVREKLTKECKRPYACETFIYSKPIGNTKTEGPSIRFAESAIRCMGNIAIENNAIYDDENKKIIRVMAIDIESNTSYYLDAEIEKTVERKNIKKGDVVISKRYNSYNQIVYTIRAREDELITKQNAVISKAIRTIGLRLIPGDIIDECMDIIKNTLKSKDKNDPEAAKRKVFDAFGTIGVGVEDLKFYLGHDAKLLSFAELQELRGIYQAIKDGDVTWRTVVAEIDDNKKPEPKNKDKDLLKKEEKKTDSKRKEDANLSSTQIELSEKQMAIAEEIGEDNVEYLERLLKDRKTIKGEEGLQHLNDMQCTTILASIGGFKQKIIELKNDEQ